MPKVILGFSGGIDSTAAVDTLHEWGYETIALTLDLTKNNQATIKAQGKARELGIEHHTLALHELFEREIVQNFIGEYLVGRTPAPCTRCNPLIKWRSIEEFADSQGVEYIATGHYFKITEYNNLRYVTRAKDRRKDQSYYLWNLSQRCLARALTPMGERIKSDIKINGERESMGVCFLEGRAYADFIVERCGELAAGVIRDSEGRGVGQHNGLARYTIGQRRGEGIPAGCCVTAIDGTSGEIVVGKRTDLYSEYLEIDMCNIIDRDELLSANDIEVMVRGIGLNPEGMAHIEERDFGYSIHLSSPAWAATAGQPVVLYRGDRVIGGGYLRRAL